VSFIIYSTSQYNSSRVECTAKNMLKDGSLKVSVDVMLCILEGNTFQQLGLANDDVDSLRTVQSLV
jgi:hypothetical protein